MKYPLKDILNWDLQNWSKALYFWEDIIKDQQHTIALELGSREGGLSLWLSEYCDKVICSDLKDSEATASPLHKHHKVKNIEYEDISALDIPYENHFDIIIMKSIIGGIAQGDNKHIQQAVFDQIYKALKPGGILLFAENVKASKFHQYFRKKFNKWSAYWRYVTSDEIKEFTQQFSEVEIKNNGFLGTFGRSDKQKNMLGKVDKSVLDKIIPSNLKYIAYGFARK